MSLRKSLISLRVLALLQSVLMLAQTALAGGFLGGHFDMLRMHGLLGRGIVVVALLMAVAAFLVRRSGGPKTVFPASLVVLLALIGQMMLGLNRSVASHVLLGVILVSAVAVLSQRAMTTPLPAARTAAPVREKAPSTELVP
ncbi:hypothetical protein [Streptomyces sp. CRN 30]|uniref:hypothetical protein n=1 Tax=Streptomyces sp. CRN 30 TaxID=3075613 RepID=UPI002A83A71B|nr:hypothetical protein [Streptomyces sp. CRN 30]